MLSFHYCQTCRYSSAVSGPRSLAHRVMYRRRRRGYQVHVAILRTSKAIHREAVLILYGDNTFLYQSTDSFFWRSQTRNFHDSGERLRLGHAGCMLHKALESRPLNTYLYWISHLELYFGDTRTPWEQTCATSMVRELAKRPNQLKTLNLELWEGLGAKWQEVNILSRLGQVKVSQRLTFTVWYTGVGNFEFGCLHEQQTGSMSDGEYAVESASVEIDWPGHRLYYPRDSRWTRKQWVMVPKTG